MADRQPGDPLSWLAETKFHPPSLREDVIPRKSLVDNLHSLLPNTPLTLLSAPAGYGKTTLLAALPSFYHDLPVAWLSLDVDDNDPVRFLTALIAAMQRLNPLCGTIAQSVLTSLPNAAAKVRSVMNVLINDVVETLSDPFILILDDLHLINEPAIFIALDYLLERRPPQLHLVVATRVDPPLALARLRARGEVAELRSSELRFSDEETSAFLNNRLRLGLSNADLALLQSRTEGWPVGLRLLASSLDRTTSPESRKIVIHHLQQTDRHVFDFLAQEVFNRQEAEEKSFLLETAVLHELTATSCQAVTRRADAGEMLEELYRRNLFLVRTEGQPVRKPGPSEALQHPGLPAFQPSYRYHDLFAEFLNHKLQQEMPERVPGLHLRAARAQSDGSRAVGHYLTAERWSEAAELIEQIGAEMFNRGYLDTLSRWINALPASVRESHPRLLHYLSNCAFLKGSWQEMKSLLERALQGFEAAGDETGQGEVLVNLATCAVGLGDLEEGAALYGQALTYPIPPHTRVQALLGRALATGMWQDRAQVEQDFNAAMALVQQSDELNALHLMTFPYFHQDFAFLPGGLEHLERIAREARAQVGDEVSPSRLMVEEMTTVLHLFRGQLAEAIRIGKRALILRERLGGHPYLHLDAALFLMIAHAARGDFAAVEPLFDKLFLGIDQTDQPPLDLPVGLFYVARVRWLQGRPQAVRKIHARMSALLEKLQLLDDPGGQICLAWIWSLLEVAEGRSTEAERALHQPEVLEQRDRSSTVHGSTRLMLARLYWHQGRLREALAELEPVLAFHEQLGIPFAILVEGQSIVPLLRLAVDQGIHERYAAYLLEVLAVDDAPRPIDVPHTGATLTPREAEVLRLLVAGLSNQAIAERLVISEWTVKSHLTRVYRKLDVSSRTQASVRAREMGLG